MKEELEVKEGNDFEQLMVQWRAAGGKRLKLN